jgi:hypothetical protein
MESFGIPVVKSVLHRPNAFAEGHVQRPGVDSDPARAGTAGLNLVTGPGKLIRKPGRTESDKTLSYIHFW